MTMHPRHAPAQDKPSLVCLQSKEEASRSLWSEAERKEIMLKKAINDAGLMAACDPGDPL